MKAIEKGWNKAGSVADTNKGTDSDETLINKKYILRRISFFDDKNSEYYVTTGMNVVRITRKELTVCGKMNERQRLSGSGCNQK